MPLDAKARDQVIRTIIGEAGNQGPEGWAAVANVIKNRTDSGAWGDPLVGGVSRVVYAHKQFAGARSPNAISVSPNDPIYQRVGAIADQVFSETVPDNTGGATHFYAPKLTPTPEWAAQGKNVRRIGDQIFMTAPLNPETTAGTVNPAVIGTSAMGSPAGAADAARVFLGSISAHQKDRPGDTANLNPEFAQRLANAIKQARQEGLPVSVESAFREPGDHPSAYDLGGNSSHTYGLATDIAGLDGPNGVITKRWAQIAEMNGLHNPYGVGNATEFNHWQLPSVPLEQTPQLLAALKAAKASGNFANVWAAYQPTGETAMAGPYMQPGEGEADKAAPQASPVAAIAPSGSASTPGTGQSQPAGSPGVNERFPLLTGMTTGVGSREPAYITSMNLFGGGTSAPAAPAAPATAPLDQKGAPVMSPNRYDPLSSGNTGQPPVTPGAPVMSPNRYDPLSSGNTGQPPAAPAPTSTLPPPLFAAAQNLLKSLFPVG